MVDALSPTMTLRDFENGYWYLEQLKNFAERIGKGVTRAEAIAAWTELKELDVPKDMRLGSRRERSPRERAGDIGGARHTYVSGR